jgi:GxxExxY protein
VNFVPFVVKTHRHRNHRKKIHHEGHEGRQKGRTIESSMDFDPLSNRVIGCAIEVHRILGPGLLESTYEQCLAHELSHAGLEFKMQYALPVQYKGLKLDCGYRVDVVVEERLILELKCVDQILPVHQAQLLTYMKLAKIQTGLLINFNLTHLKEGIKRFVI